MMVDERSLPLFDGLTKLAEQQPTPFTYATLEEGFKALGDDNPENVLAAAYCHYMQKGRLSHRIIRKLNRIEKLTPTEAFLRDVLTRNLATLEVKNIYNQPTRVLASTNEILLETENPTLHLYILLLRNYIQTLTPQPICVDS